MGNLHFCEICSKGENYDNNKETINENILAIGDCLTNGYFKNGAKYHPYSRRLNELLAGNNFNYSG